MTKITLVAGADPCYYVLMTTSTSVLVHSTSTGDVAEPEINEDICLGSQGVISTSQCVRIAERLTGEPCPLCIL